MHNDSLPFYEQLKNLRSSSEIIIKITLRIKHAEEALRQNAFKLDTQINIEPGVWLSWEDYQYPDQKKSQYRIVLTTGDERRPFNDTPFTARLRYYKYLIVLIGKVNETLSDLIKDVNFDQDPIEGFDAFEVDLEKQVMKGE